MLAMICTELLNNTIRENVLIDAYDHVEREKCLCYFIDATPLRDIGGCQKINNKRLLYCYRSSSVKNILHYSSLCTLGSFTATRVKIEAQLQPSDT